MIIIFEPTGQQFKILYQNMQSIYNKQPLLEAFLDENPDYQALCISETWLTDDKLKLMQFSGYKIAASFCRKHRTGGGVCILLKDKIQFVERCDITSMSLEYVLEVTAIELCSINIIIIVMYWNRREEELFFKQLRLILDYINNKYYKYNIIIGGDFNVNILECNNKTSEYLNLMLEYKFYQHIKTPTHITETSSTCLDHIFTNFKNYNLHSIVEELGFSDHAGTTMLLKIPKITEQKQKWYIEKRLFNNSQMSQFKKQLQTVDWHNVINSSKKYK